MMKKPTFNPKMIFGVAFLLLLIVFVSCDENSLNEVSEDLLNAEENRALCLPPDDPNDDNDNGGLTCNEMTVCLVTSHGINIGTVTVSNDAQGNISVTFDTDDEWDILEAHVEIDEYDDTSARKIGSPSKKGGNSYQKDRSHPKMSFLNPKDSLTMIIPNPLDGFGCMSISAHAIVISNDFTKDVAWGQECEEELSNARTSCSPSKTNREKHSYEKKHKKKDHNCGDHGWGTSFEYCSESCIYNFAWEDLTDSGNDQDYNDLVVESELGYNGSIYSLMFKIKARGASYNHDFKIKLLKSDVPASMDITGDITNISDEGSFWLVTILENTFDDPDLAGKYRGFAHNTVIDPVNGCNTTGTYAERAVYLTNASLTGNEQIPPFDPVLSVDANKADGNDVNDYDLNIWEIHSYEANMGTKWFDYAGNTYIKNGKVYPNGILIPKNWYWPQELQSILKTYTDFTDIDGPWNPVWFDGTVDDTKLFVCP